MARHLMSCRKHALSGGKVAGQLDAGAAAPPSAAEEGRPVGLPSKAKATHEEAEVAALLEASHFENVALLDHHRSGKQVETLDFSATVQREFTMIEIAQQYGDNTCQMVAWALTPYKATSRHEMASEIKTANILRPSFSAARATQ